MKNFKKDMTPNNGIRGISGYLLSPAFLGNEKAGKVRRKSIRVINQNKCIVMKTISIFADRDYQTFMMRII